MGESGSNARDLPGGSIYKIEPAIFSLPHRRCGKTVSKVTITVQKKQEIVGLETKLSDFILYTVAAAGFLPDIVIQAGSLRFSSFGGPV